MIDSFKILGIYFLVLLLLLIFGCNSAKQSQKHYDISKRKNIVTLAENVHKDFPCITKSDTVIIDSIVVNERIVPQYFPYYIYDTITGKTDTAWVKGDCKVKDTIIYKTREVKVLDSAFILLAKDQVERVKASALEQINKTRKIEQGRDTWRVVAFIFIGIVVLILFFVVRKLF